jgi:hypothetical protein
MPVLVNRSYDLSSAVMLLGLALFLIANALYYYLTYPWIGSSLLVDEDGLLETRGNGDKLLLRWREVESFRISGSFKRWTTTQVSRGKESGFGFHCPTFHISFYLH